jgi:hypothetical protein
LREWRHLVCGAMIAILPTAVISEDNSRAMLRNTGGGTWLNGTAAPESATVFPNDLIQTQKAHVATLQAEGSDVVIGPETVTQFDGDELFLDHGTLALQTSREMKVRVGCMTIVPVSAAWTHYEVTDTDGKAHISALQNDLRIDYREVARGVKQKSQSVSVHQGEEVTREERCGAPARVIDIVDAKGTLLSVRNAAIAGATAITAVCVFYLCRQGAEPVSPANP